MYVLHLTTWSSTSGTWAYFTEAGGGYGGIFVLAPPEAAAAAALDLDAASSTASPAAFITPAGSFFPRGFASLVSSSYPYLLELRDGKGQHLCMRAAQIGLSARYDDGILCRRELRPLKVRTARPEEPSPSPSPQA